MITSVIAINSTCYQITSRITIGHCHGLRLFIGRSVAAAAGVVVVRVAAAIVVGLPSPSNHHLQLPFPSLNRLPAAVKYFRRPGIAVRGGFATGAE